MIDPEHLGVAGGSYGGFMTNWIIGHTDRFHAAASQRSISNWVSFEHNSDIGHTFILNNQGTNTRTDVELLWKQSPLQFAPNCKTPTLFIHSDETTAAIWRKDSPCSAPSSGTAARRSFACSMEKTMSCPEAESRRTGSTG